jgi:hypothetical protein
MAASGSGGMKGGIRRLKTRAVAVNVTTPSDLRRSFLSRQCIDELW